MAIGEGTHDGHGTAATASAAYADRLAGQQSARWKRFVPNPYRWYLRRQHLGFTLDVGCGVGRGLGYLGGQGVGVDHNPDAVGRCRERGFLAFTPDDFLRSAFARPGRFDALLSAHVLEHLTPEEASALLRDYVGYVRPGGHVVLITPQERGFASDPTHVTFVDDDALASLCTDAGLLVRRARSFPLPRNAGRLFVYNEFIVEASIPAGLRPGAHGESSTPRASSSTHRVPG
jgi:SAM-dependent methyltransferase